MSVVFLLIVVASSIWVGIDADNLGVRRGRLGGGLLDMGVIAWILVCLVLWIVGFPCYLVARRRYLAMGQPTAWPVPVVAPATYAAPTVASAPPQYSPDGHWWWDGRQWVPVAAAAPPV